VIEQGHKITELKMLLDRNTKQLEEKNRDYSLKEEALEKVGTSLFSGLMLVYLTLTSLD
jgi:hypothetical protein